MGHHNETLQHLFQQQREECLAKNIRQQSKMAMAKLDAHRCLLRDTVIEVPHPADVIVNFIQPSHVVVPRCTGEEDFGVKNLLQSQSAIGFGR